MFDDFTLARIQVTVRDVAKIAVREFDGIDPEDVESLLLEKVFRYPDRYEKHIDNAGWLWAALYGDAIAHCRKMIRDFMFYSAEYYYTPEEVRELLKQAYDAEVDEYIYINEATISLIDLQVAFNKLNMRDRDLLSRKYGNKEKLPESDRRACYRAVEHLTAALNGTITENSKARATHDGPGARKVLSNAQAINKTRSGENG